MNKESIIGVIGAGTMGTGIGQIAAQAGHKTIILTPTFRRWKDQDKV